MHSLENLQKAIDYVFDFDIHLQRAVTHASAKGLPGYEEDNAKLIQLGTQIQSAAVAHRLIDKYPNADSGELTRRRTFITNTEANLTLARQLKLLDYALYNKRSIIESRGKDPMIANMAVAIQGAILVDGGYEAVLAFVDKFLLPLIKDEKVKDSKSLLQESLRQALNTEPTYEANRTGPDHEPIFTVTVRVGNILLGSGRGNSKKIAEMQAAKDALMKKLWLKK